MSTPWSAWVLVLLALVLANAPFVLIRGRRARGWPLGWQIAALVLGYAAWIAAGTWLESRMAPPWRQGWAFYVVTALGFLVCAFPGAVRAHLWRRGR